MNTRIKLDTVLKVLRDSQTIAEWYREQFDLSAAAFTPDNVKAHGMGGLGDIADQILNEGLDEGVISQAEYEAA